MATITSSSRSALRPGPRRPHRVVVLCGEGVMHRNTCATLLRAGVNLVGIVSCARRGVRARADRARRRIARHGFGRTVGQILGRVYDRMKNRNADERLLARLVDDAANRAMIEGADVPVVRTDSYARSDTLEALRHMDPDILVVHTKYLVGRRVRELARVAVIGGHPGITPYYRGAYSPFWALRHGRPDMVGFTVFLLDDGVDTGPILAQERVLIVPREDSHLTLAWKGMLRESELQARAILKLDAGECVAVCPIEQVPEGSYFDLPTLLDFVRYRRMQRLVR